MVKEVHLSLDEPRMMFTITHALASEVRIDILNLLDTASLNVNEIAEKLGIPPSTAATNVKILEDSGLILTELQPGVRGSMKLCSRRYDLISLQLFKDKPNALANTISYSMPIGNFTDCLVFPSCGIVNENHHLDRDDQPENFYHPLRHTAQLLWLCNGYVEYRFSSGFLRLGKPKLIEVSAELCSEAPNYRNNWPSDISVWLNSKHIGAWRCPGDFGGRRGKLNPTWWSDVNTQYGLLKTWRVSEAGSFVDESPSARTTISDLELTQQNYVTLRIGIAPDAQCKGGLNLFGAKFGDYAQDIVMRVDYDLI